LRSQNGVFCEIFRVNQIFLNAFAEKRYFKEVPLVLNTTYYLPEKLQDNYLTEWIEEFELVY